MGTFRRFRYRLAVVGLAIAVVPVSAAPAAAGPGGVAAAVPAPATLTIHKGGDRTGPEAVAGLPGATFDIFAGVEGTRPGPADTPDASCTTGADGTCSVDVAARTGPNQGYWIIERSAPAGFAVIEALATGGNTTTPTIYNGIFTGQVTAGHSYSFPVATTGDSNRTARGSQWADRRDNPDLPGRCGLNVALLMDVSGSIAPFLPAVKNAANGFVTALAGTPSHIAVYSFATTAQAVLGPTAVSEPAGVDEVHDAINGLSAGGGTNWDAGLFKVATAPVPYDVVVMLTDGNPTFYGPGSHPQGPGNFTRFIEVENGVFSANAVKAVGTKVVAVGVGAGISGSALNLEAISGPIRGVDFIQTDYAALAAVFRALALANCAGTITVVKKVIPPGGTPADALPAGGWTMQTTTAGVTPSSGVTANGSGAVSFTARFGDRTTLAVTITETVQSGFVLVPQDGANAVCTVDGAPADSTNVGANGFTVDAVRAGIVSCTLLNQEPAAEASVVVNKTWIINGTSYPDPTQPSEFEATPELTGQATPIWGEEYSGYTAGATVEVGEDVDGRLLPPDCRNAPGGDLGPQVLGPGLNTFTVLNTVSCITTLTLFKAVVNPFGDPEPLDSWTLAAFPNGEHPPAFSGTTGVQHSIRADTPYSLGETRVSGYRQDRIPGAVIVAPATGSWDCALRLRGDVLGAQEYDGSDGIIVVQLGHRAECTAKNTADPASLTLIKAVHNRHGGTAPATAWILSATPPDGTGGPITGRSGDPAVTDAIATPNLAYTLAESGGPAGYVASAPVSCVLNRGQTPVATPDGVLTPLIGQDITCTFANVDVEPRLTLVKEVDNAGGGHASPTDWLLSARPSGSAAAITGRSGTPAVTAVPATAAIAYRLSESDGPAHYAASVSCALSATRTAVPVTGGAVTLGVGQDVTCTFVNLSLPVTGERISPIARAGALLLVGGVGLAFAGRRRRGARSRAA